MPAIGKVLVAVTGDLQPCLMHQRGGLQRLAGFLISHADNGQLAQLLIDQRQQLIGRLRLARFNGVEQLGNVGHGSGYMKCLRGSELDVMAQKTANTFAITVSDVQCSSRI